MAMIYASVVRWTNVVADLTNFDANFKQIVHGCLLNLSSNNNNKFMTFKCDGHTFHYLREDGYTYCVVARELAVFLGLSWASKGQLYIIWYWEGLYNSSLQNLGQSWWNIWSTVVIIRMRWASLQRRKFNSYHIVWYCTEIINNIAHFIC